MDEQMLFMTPLQCAYMLERSRDNGVPCRVYMEYKSDSTELGCLRKAWIELFRIHPVMRAVCDQCGYMEIPPFDPDYCGKSFTVWSSGSDLRSLISYRKLDVENDYACRLHAVCSGNSVVRIIFELELVICDVHSFLLIMRDLADVYSAFHKGIVCDISPDDFSVLRTVQDKEWLAAARDYWSDRLSGASTVFPFTVRSGYDKVGLSGYEDLNAERDSASAYALLRTAEKFGADMDELLLLAFCYAVMKSSGICELIVNYPFIVRNEDNFNIAADLTHCMLFRCSCGNDSDLADFIRSAHDDYRCDMLNSCFDGLEAQKLLKAGNNSKYPVPLVFSPSLTIPVETEISRESVGSLEHIISSTPGVLLDAQTYRKNGGLFFTWVIPTDVLDNTQVQNAFHLFLSCLDKLIEME